MSIPVNTHTPFSVHFIREKLQLWSEKTPGSVQQPALLPSVQDLSAQHKPLLPQFVFPGPFYSGTSTEQIL